MHIYYPYHHVMAYVYMDFPNVENIDINSIKEKGKDRGSHPIASSWEGRWRPGGRSAEKCVDNELWWRPAVANLGPEPCREDCARGLGRHRIRLVGSHGGYRRVRIGLVAEARPGGGDGTTRGRAATCP